MPAAHVLHDDWPVWSWYVPGGHCTFTAGPAGHIQPGGHVTVLLVELPGQYWPAPQFRHESAPASGA